MSMSKKHEYYPPNEVVEDKSWWDKHPKAMSAVYLGGTTAFCIAATVVTVEIFAIAISRRVVKKIGKGV